MLRQYNVNMIRNNE